MANATVGFQSPQRAPIGGTKESLLDLVVTIDPLETFVTSNAPTVKVTDILHSWTAKSPRAVASRSQAEGADPTFDNTYTTRVSNMTQIISVGYELTGTRMAVDATGGDAWARERNEAMTAWKNALEYDVIRGSKVTAQSGVAGKMNGLKSFASTLATSRSGVSLDENTVNEYLGLAWAQGVKIDTILVGRVLKSRISGFTAGNTKFVPAGDKTIWGAVDVLETDFGRVRVILHRFVTVSGDTNQDFLAYDSKYVKIGYLREPRYEKLAKTGDAQREQIIGEATLQVDTEKAVLYVAKVL